jgi:hypothetical protein
MLPALHEILDDHGTIAERCQRLHDPIDTQVAREENGPRCVFFDDLVIFGQMMTVPVLIGMIDEPDAPGEQGIVEHAVLRRREHPTSIDGQGGFVLLGDPTHGS